MTDIVITPGNVISGAGSSARDATSGTAVVAGKVVAVDPATSKYVLADSNHATPGIRVAKGIALNGASDNQPMKVHTKGPIVIGGALTPGVAYYLSDTPGGICPVADVGAGERAVLLGIATSATVLDVDIQDSGVTL